MLLTHFLMYEKLLSDNNLKEKPECIFNLDEIGLNTDRTNEHVFVNKSNKNCYLKSPQSGKTMFTVMFCISAIGIYLPPFTLYKAKYLYENWTKGGPPGAAYSVSESGWMMGNTFENWFVTIFVKYVERYDKPVLLTYDGHNSHLTYDTVEAAIDNQIIILCLPPNTSHAIDIEKKGENKI
ncbi:unnamed protein product [Meganyctiphanes norvegica]|uniref:DDE-1 domain-containing protein n=1 Tax=Meganyctiphanes norvegica TaxID=48144 RepID=A0AAV2SV07_MEGNR